MPRIHNRAKMSVTGTPGTGTVTLNAASSGFQTFATAGIQDGDLVDYVIEDGSNFEVGIGTYTASGTTLARTVVKDSSSGFGSAISATSSAIVYVTVMDASVVTRGKAFATMTGQQWA